MMASGMDSMTAEHIKNNASKKLSPRLSLCFTGCLVVHGIGSQSGVRGPPGVPEGVPGGPQINDSKEPNGLL